MFSKYTNRFKKAEVEWVREVLDMHDGDEPKARAAVAAATQRVIEWNEHLLQDEPAGELTPFEHSVAAACFASPGWWDYGLSLIAIEIPFSCEVANG